MSATLQKELLLIAHGVVGAIIVGALMGVLHYFGVPVPPSLVLPSMAIGGAGVVHMA